MKTLAQSNVASHVGHCQNCTCLLEDRKCGRPMWRTGISGGEGGRAVFSLTRGGATDLRSVPEPSLADSIFSLEDANVQDLGELDVFDCKRRGVCVGGEVHACLTGCLPQALGSGLAAADQLGSRSASPWPPFAPCTHREAEIEFCSGLRAITSALCCNNHFFDRKIHPSVPQIRVQDGVFHTVTVVQSGFPAAPAAQTQSNMYKGVTWSPSRSPAEASRTPRRPLPLLRHWPSGRAAPR